MKKISCNAKGIEREPHAKKKMAYYLFFSRRFWVEETRHSENISVEKIEYLSAYQVYLSRNPRPVDRSKSVAFDTYIS